MSDQVTEMGATYLVEAADSTLPIGYKQTEVGVIPEEWEVKKLKEISPSQSVGLVINPSSYYSNRGTIPMLVGSHIYENRINWTTANRITTESNAKLPASRLYQGDLVTVRVGDPGVTSVIPPELDQSNCASMMIVRQGDKFNSQWLCFLMNSSIGKSRIEGVQYGTAQKQFNIIDAVDFLFPFPPKQEQTAIANALSDVDALTSELEKLVAKKQAIKTATMQQLLTGRSRLPQFALHEDGTPKGYKQSELGEIPEDWDAIKMSELARIQRGASPRPIDSPVWFNRNSSVGWLRISDVSKTNKYLTETTQSLSELGIANSRFVSKNNLVMSICATVGKPIITKKDLCIHDGFVVFNGLSVNQDLMYYILKELEDEWGKQGQTGSQMNLNTDLINGTYVAIPDNEQEQAAIATIFSDMDKEIQALEQRLGKTRQIKQGMMQELLTGKTRLVVPAA
ncbi:restriction endonuclease subunit S [Halomonas sp. IOP_6]|uniref:restriction endonuclease subunit S n=1 Tax=Halomonas sp. IOP_6 TaxID=2876583 RepID=UPI001E321E29|nr:restriction endonuclease subunit S [Halomonas sp. IOP_6]MCD6004951.1 restriction endonuclease subunit S [Halomonas sp. IOP_6]